MDLRKAKTLCLPVVCCMALALAFFQAPAKCYGFDIEIEIDPIGCEDICESHRRSD